MSAFTDDLMQSPLSPHDFWMKKALDQAVLAFDQGEVPVGAVIVHGNRVIAEACNQREMLQDPTAHAEMIAMTQAAEALQSWRLLDCTLYVTLEPCPMCTAQLSRHASRSWSTARRTPKPAPAIRCLTSPQTSG